MQCVCTEFSWSKSLLLSSTRRCWNRHFWVRFYFKSYFLKVFWLVRMLMVWRVKYIHVVCCKQWLRGMFTIFSVVDDIFLFLEVIILFQDFIIHEVCHKLYLLFIFCSYLLYQNLSFFFKRKYAANLFIEFYLFLKKDLLSLLI